LVGRQTNLALCQLPDRRFPGLLIQGDTVKTLAELVGELAAAYANADHEGTTAALEELTETVGSFVGSYESMMRAAGRELPYVSTSTERA
jgi:uncharacterized protein DUF6959